jgi:rubrerythrin
VFTTHRKTWIAFASLLGSMGLAMGGLAQPAGAPPSTPPGPGGSTKPVAPPKPYESEADDGTMLNNTYLNATTLQNLQAAFNGESNARAKYLAFAERADSEGYGQVASLFRAAARAEQIHAENHAEVIKVLGAEPKAEIKLPEIQTTKENLQAAVKGETEERSTMYPSMIKRARADQNRQAIRSFNFAMTAEAEHAKLYQKALDNLEQWKQGTKDFYVCKVCGYTVTAITFKKCPSCFIGKDEYEKVN